jgi:hypothetical protein
MPPYFSSACCRKPGALVLKSGVPGWRMASSIAAARALALLAGSKDLVERFNCHRLATEITRPVRKLEPVGEPPLFNQLRIGPRQVFVRIHVHVLVFGILRWPGFETLRLVGVQIVIGEVDSGNVGERFARHPSHIRIAIC